MASNSADIFMDEEQYLKQHQVNSANFHLSQQQKNNINRRLPRGFMLQKVNQVQASQTFHGDIEYVPLKRQPRIASEELNKKFLSQPFVSQPGVPKQIAKQQLGVDRTGLRFSQLPQGKSKHAEKIKAILQKFRKHPKYNALAQYMQRIGLMSAFMQIEAQNKKNIHTIDSFKERTMIIFKQAKAVTYDEVMVNLIAELIDEFLFHVEQARKSEFESNLMLIQKSIDRVTRQISDIKEYGNYYYRKKKKNQKNYDERELLYISDLIRALPQKDRVGIFEIIEEKPFQEITDPQLVFDLGRLKPKKVRQIEFYAKRKLINHFRSRERKIEKKQRKREQRKAEKERLKAQEARSCRVSLEQGRSVQEERDEGMQDYLFGGMDEEAPRRERPSAMDEALKNFDFDEKPLSNPGFMDEQEDLFFAPDPVPIHDRRREPQLFESFRREDRKSSAVFEEPKLLLSNKNDEPVDASDSQEDNNSSDSSMITDQEDSEF